LDLVLLLVRLVLAAVFAVAALGKFADREASREALERFGVPLGLVGPTSLGLPVTEIVVAAGLVVVASAAWSALAAAALLIAFCVAIVRLLARGEAPDCHCFGTLSSAPVGRGTLARNLVLLGLAAFVAVAGFNHPGESVSKFAAELGAVAIVLGAAMVLHAAFSWQLFRQNGRLLDRLEALEANPGQRGGEGYSRVLARGMPAPSFALPDLDGQVITLEDLLAEGSGALLFFTDPGCGHCDPLLPVLAAPHDGPPVAVISRGSVQANRAKAGRHGLTPILLQNDFEVADAYRAYGMPGAVLVDRAGRIASGTAAGANDVLALLRIPAAPALDLVHVEGAV
jgi:peroxiredoxin